MNRSLPARLTAVTPAAPAQRRSNDRRSLPVTTQRRLAKTGMALSLGVLVWSALAGRRLLRRYHVIAGVALLGFTAWHMTLYKPKHSDAELPPARRAP